MHVTAELVSKSNLTWDQTSTLLVQRGHCVTGCKAQMLIMRPMFVCSASFWCQRENLRSRLLRSFRCLTRAAEFDTAVCMAELLKDHRLESFREVGIVEIRPCSRAML